MGLNLSNFNGVIAPLYDLVLPKRKPVEFLSLLNAQKGDIILEIGAGTGRIAKHYANSVNDVTLLDPALNMLKRAKKIVPNVKIVEGVSEKMYFNSNYFDKIVCYDSLHHWQDQVKGLKETFRVLKPGGTLIFMEVDISKIAGAAVQFLERILKMNSRMFKPNDLKMLLEKLNYKNLYYDPTNNGLTYAMVCTK